MMTAMKRVFAQLLALAVVLVAVAPVRADTSNPAPGAAPPRCGSRGYRAMTAAADARCRSEVDGHARQICTLLVQAMQKCSAELRTDAGGVTFQIALGGEWIGARFERSGDAWRFTGFVGGDIP
jgi:hypothetical protein